MLTPPLEVMRPAPAASVPTETALPGGVQYSAKMDGYRILAFHDGPAVVLQTRAGNDLAARFPEVVRAVTDETPPGVILDGELVAADAEGKSVFTALATGPAARRRARIHVSYVAFDLLVENGADIRGLPLAQRWDRLKMLLATAGPPLGLVPVTTDRSEAIGWMRLLGPYGVEGVVAKGLETPYVPRQSSAAWRKVRTADTVDAHAIALIGSPTRPSAVVLRLADGRTAVASLSAITSRQLAAAARGLIDEQAATSHRIHGELLVEVRVGTSRHSSAKVVRIRPQRT